MNEEMKNKATELTDEETARVSGGLYDDFDKKGSYMTNPNYQMTYYCQCGQICNALTDDSKFIDIFKNSKPCSWCSPVGGPCAPHICGNCSHWSYC